MEAEMPEAYEFHTIPQNEYIELPEALKKK
jgi:hypothetical protein